MGIVAKIISRFKTWPPLEEDFAKGLWGMTIWDTEKVPTRKGDVGKLVSYFQSVYNRYCGPSKPLKVDGWLGPITEAAIMKFQQAYGLPMTGIIDEATWDMVDWVAFESYWKVTGKNKYNGQPVNDHGMTRPAAFVECYVRAKFPERKFPRNWMVDRNMRGSKRLSDHAEGKALDFTKITIAQGTPVAEWIGARAHRWNIVYQIYNRRTLEPEGGRRNYKTAARYLWRKILPTSLQHTDHIHVTCALDAFPAVQFALAA